MIGALLDFLRRSAGQLSPSSSSPPTVAIDDTSWKEEFESVLARSVERPRLLVEHARKGFPNSLRGWAWCKILRTGEVPYYLKDFERELYRIFGTVDPVHFQPPCFGSPIDWANINLSPLKKEAIKKILCIIGDTHPELEFAPFIPAIVAVLTKHLGSNDVLACMAAMIEGHSIPAFKRQDWAYFPLHRRDYLVFERVFEDLTKTYAPKVARHVSKLQLFSPDFVPVWDRILSCLFIGILPRELVLRIFDAYLVEGYKIVLRFAIAHIIIRQGLLLSTKNPECFNNFLTKSATLSPETIDLYFKTALGVKFDRSIIQRYRNRRRKHSIGDFDAEDKLLIFQRPLPQLIKPSSFMRDQDWAALWSWVPARFKLLNLDLTFTTTSDGKHLSTLLSKCKDQEPIILLVETVSGKVFGAYISKALNLENGPSFYGTGETFLFSIKPEAKKFSWDMTSESLAFICVTESFLAFGGGSDFGLWLDRFLSQVTSGSSLTFKNEPLLDKYSADDLQIFCVEAFRFV